MKNILNKNSESFSQKKLDWKVIQEDMKKKFGNDIFESWLRKIVFVDEFNNYVLISVSTRFIRDWITSRYLDQILKIIRTYKKEIGRIEFIINEKRENKVENINANSLETNINVNKNVSFI